MHECICTARADVASRVPPEADEPTRPTSRNMSSAAMTKAAPESTSPDPPLSLIGATPCHGNLPATGCRLFSEVTLSRRRHFHRVSLPRSPRVSRRAKADSHRAIRSERSSARPCATAAVAACTAARRSSSTSRRSITCIRCRTAARTRPGNVVLACGSLQSPQGRPAADRILRALSVGGTELHRPRARRSSCAQAMRAAGGQPCALSRGRRAMSGRSVVHRPQIRSLRSPSG